MLEINVVAKGLGWITLVGTIILIPLIVTMVGWYIADKNWRFRVNRFFLKCYLTVKGNYFRRRRNLVAPFDRIAVCTLGDPAGENGAGGIMLIDRKGHNDGATVKEIIGKEFVRRTDNKNDKLYLYFAFNEQIVENFRNKPIIILVEYLDQDQGEANSTIDDGKRGLHLKYDSVGEDFEARWKKAGDVGFTDINGGWKWAGFNIKDGNFRRRQNDVGDFRIGCRYANPKRDYDLYLRRVIAVIP